VEVNRGNDGDQLGGPFHGLNGTCTNSGNAKTGSEPLGAVGICRVDEQFDANAWARGEPRQVLLSKSCADDCDAHSHPSAQTLT
jgi:hypothetical protein